MKCIASRSSMQMSRKRTAILTSSRMMVTAVWTKQAGSGRRRRGSAPLRAVINHGWTRSAGAYGSGFARDLIRCPDSPPIFDAPQTFPEFLTARQYSTRHGPPRRETVRNDSAKSAELFRTRDEKEATIKETNAKLKLVKPEATIATSYVSHATIRTH